MRCLLMLLTVLLAGLSSNCWASSYNFVSPEELKSRMEANQPMVLVDIQVEKEFGAHHLEGAVPTFAYPVKSEAERKKIDPVIEKLKTNPQDVVIICPRGKGGAKRCYDYMVSRGIPEEKIAILQKGQGGWPYKEFLVSDK